MLSGFVLKLVPFGTGLVEGVKNVVAPSAYRLGQKQLTIFSFLALKSV